MEPAMERPEEPDHGPRWRPDRFALQRNGDISGSFVFGVHGIHRAANWPAQGVPGKAGSVSSAATASGRNPFMTRYRPSPNSQVAIGSTATRASRSTLSPDHPNSVAKLKVTRVTAPRNPSSGSPRGTRRDRYMSVPRSRALTAGTRLWPTKKTRFLPTPLEVAQQLRTSQSGMTGKLDRLEEQGLIERVPDADD